MSSLKQLSGRQIVKALEKAGWKAVRQKGSHIRLQRVDDLRRPLTVPNYKVIGIGLIRKILRDAHLTKEEFKKLL